MSTHSTHGHTQLTTTRTGVRVKTSTASGATCIRFDLRFPFLHTDHPTNAWPRLVATYVTITFEGTHGKCSICTSSKGVIMEGTRTTLPAGVSWHVKPIQRLSRRSCRPLAVRCTHARGQRIFLSKTLKDLRTCSKLFCVAGDSGRYERWRQLNSRRRRRPGSQ